MAHPSHRLKAYMAEHHKKLVFCECCGREEDEGLDEPCAETFSVNRRVDKRKEPNVGSNH